MRFLVLWVAILGATVTAWAPEYQGKAHKIRIVVPHKITYVHHHHHHSPKHVFHRHDSEEDDGGSSEEHQEARVGPPRYAVLASKRSNGAPPFSYRDFFRKRTKLPPRYFRYEDDRRRWPEEEDPLDSDEVR